MSSWAFRRRCARFEGGGLFLCSGIIDDRADEVAACLRRDGWDIAETRQSEGWFSFLCR